MYLGPVRLLSMYLSPSYTGLSRVIGGRVTARPARVSPPPAAIVAPSTASTHRNLTLDKHSWTDLCLMSVSTRALYDPGAQPRRVEPGPSIAWVSFSKETETASRSAAVFPNC
jgi:hypothetical protein